MKRATPIISVDEIEPCVLFWTTLGFTVTAEVPHDDKLGFVMLNSGDVELMYQSRASVQADLENTGGPEGLADEMADSTATLFLEVDSVDEVLETLGAVEIIVPRRETFYGMDEIWVRAPCRTIVGFAARVEGSEAQ